MPNLEVRALEVHLKAAINANINVMDRFHIPGVLGSSDHYRCVNYSGEQETYRIYIYIFLQCHLLHYLNKMSTIVFPLLFLKEERVRREKCEIYIYLFIFFVKMRFIDF